MELENGSVRDGFKATEHTGFISTNGEVPVKLFHSS